MLNIPSLQASVSPEEWQLRCDLAACYRLVALYGMSDLVFTHISAKLPAAVTGGEEHSLLATFPADTRLPEGWRVIGAVRPGSGVTVDGVPRRGGGWDHFSG